MDTSPLDTNRSRENRADFLFGNGAFIITVVIGLITVLVALDDALPAQVFALCALVVVYCVVGTLGFARAESSSSPPALITYFTVQIALAAFIAYLGTGVSKGDSAIWLVFMPLVSHAITSLRPRSAFFVSVLIVVAFFGVIWLLYRSVNPVSVLQYASGVSFVAFFTYIAAREQRNRMQMEQLAVQLRDANRTLSEYATQIEELATTRERNRIARDVHDSLGHYLTTVNMQLEAARAVLVTDPDKAAEALGKAQSLTKEGLSEVRRSVAALRAGPMDDRNLIDAIDSLVDEARERGLDINLAVTGERRALAPQIEMTLYRATQEALTNVRKHAKASHVGVLLAYQADSVQLTVRDNGTSVSEPSGDGFGLMGLRERAQLLGGTVRTYSGRGFVLEVEIPA